MEHIHIFKIVAAVAVIGLVVYFLMKNKKTEAPSQVEKTEEEAPMAPPEEPLG